MTRSTEYRVPKTERFWNFIAKRYARQPVADEASYQKKLDVTQTYFRPDSEVLEFGCGTGSTAIAHAPKVKHIRATDVSSKMLEIARGKAEAQGVENIAFEQVAIEDLEAPDGSFDMVMAHSILHLLEDKESAIAKALRMLKPGGVFVTSTVCLGDSAKWFRFIAPAGHFLGVLPLVKFFTAEELETAFIGAGFEIDYKWRPGPDSAVFMIGKKPG
jgi:ubiquinone/menaquinone biosynthesis C-methylase UbiE